MSDSHAMGNTDALVHVVDDEPSTRQLFESICRRMGLQARTYDRAEAFLEQVDPVHPGCLILDVRLPGMSGLELLEEISRRGWEIPVIIISGRAAVSTAVQAFRLGSIDFLEKPFSTEEVMQCVRRAVELDSRQRQSGARLAEIRKRTAKLTRRETQVMGLVVSGKSNRLIAEELGVSPKTIEVHRANVMLKMQADSLADLVKMSVADKAGETAAPEESA